MESQILLIGPPYKPLDIASLASLIECVTSRVVMTDNMEPKRLFLFDKRKMSSNLSSSLSQRSQSLDLFPRDMSSQKDLSSKDDNILDHQLLSSEQKLCLQSLSHMILSPSAPQELKTAVSYLRSFLSYIKMGRQHLRLMGQYLETCKTSIHELEIRNDALNAATCNLTGKCV